MKRSLLWGAIVLLSGLLIGLLFWSPKTNETHTALPLAEAPAGGDFVLRSAGGPIALKDLRGKVVVLYFGYTWCPDICPTSLGYLSAALEQLTPEELARVQPIFVSVDPERDNLERLEEYAAYFHISIIGVTGTPEEVAEVASRYGAAYRRSEQSDSAMGYVIDHSADLYLIDIHGRLVKTLPHGTPPAKLVQALRELLVESSSN
ncbi:MAG TPA: SCO family protein [Chromatiales bacterium]|nr:SCO family protein [Chromatiales bacterium]